MRIHLPYRGQPRFIKKFAVLPIKIGNEIIWGEMAYIRQEWRPDLTHHGWYNEKFLDKEEYEKLAR